MSCHLREVKTIYCFFLQHMYLCQNCSQAEAGSKSTKQGNSCLLVYIALLPPVMATNISRGLGWLWIHKFLNEHVQWPRFICSHLLINGGVLETFIQTCLLMKLLLPKIEWQRGSHAWERLLGFASQNFFNEWFLLFKTHYFSIFTPPCLLFGNTLRISNYLALQFLHSSKAD